MKLKIKITFIIDAINSVAGTEKQLLQTIQQLDKQQFDITLICLRKPSATFQPNPELFEYKELNIDRLLSWKALFKLLETVSFLRRKRVDIVQTFFFDGNIFGIFAAKLAGVKHIISCRRDMGFWYTPMILIILRIMNNLVDRFLVNSYAIKKNISRYERIPCEKIDVIYNGIGIEPYKKKYNTSIIKKELNIDEKSVVIGIVANLNRRVKRVDLFIKAAQKALLKNNGLYFIIIGDGFLRKELEQLAIKLNIDGKVMFTGLKADVIPYLSFFNIGVISSDSEGFSNSIIEYAASGIPVIATDTGGNREIIQKGEFGELVPINDPDKMSESIIKFANNQELVERMSRKAKKFVRNSLDWRFKIMEIERYYSNLLLTENKGINKVEN